MNFALEIVTSLSSKGCRKTSSTFFLNSGNSSKNNTPLCDSEISPGCGYEPPPTKATSEIVWCGDLYGLVVINPFSVFNFPATE